MSLGTTEILIFAAMLLPKILLFSVCGFIIYKLIKRKK